MSLVIGQDRGLWVRFRGWLHRKSFKWTNPLACPYSLCDGLLTRANEYDRQAICSKCWEPFVLSLGRWPPKIKVTPEQERFWRERHLPQIKVNKPMSKKEKSTHVHERTENGSPKPCGKTECGQWEGNVWVWHSGPRTPIPILRDWANGVPLRAFQRDILYKAARNPTFFEEAKVAFGSDPARLANLKLQIESDIRRIDGTDSAVLANQARLAKEEERLRKSGYLLPCGHRTQVLSTGGHRLDFPTTLVSGSQQRVNVGSPSTSGSRVVCLYDSRVFIPFQKPDGSITFTETKEPSIPPSSPQPKMFEDRTWR